MNRTNEFTFLEGSQFFGNQKLSVIGKRGTRASISDFAILLGGFVSESFYVKDAPETYENRAGVYWTKTDDMDGDALAV